MIVKMIAIVEPGETKADVSKLLQEKYAAILPAPNVCIKAEKRVTEKGRYIEFLVDVDVLVASVKRQIEYTAKILADKIIEERKQELINNVRSTDS